MNLTQELLNIKPTPQVDEDVKNPIRYKQFMKSINNLEDLFDRIRATVKDGSVTGKIAVELGGDDANRRAALDALDTLEYAVMDWHMSVRMAQDDQDMNPDTGN